MMFPGKPMRLGPFMFMLMMLMLMMHDSSVMGFPPHRDCHLIEMMTSLSPPPSSTAKMTAITGVMGHLFEPTQNTNAPVPLITTYYDVSATSSSNLPPVELSTMPNEAGEALPIALSLL